MQNYVYNILIKYKFCIFLHIEKIDFQYLIYGITNQN
jgi:hypothetical protein